MGLTMTLEWTKWRGRQAGKSEREDGRTETVGRQFIYVCVCVCYKAKATTHSLDGCRCCAASLTETCPASDPKTCKI